MPNDLINFEVCGTFTKTDNRHARDVTVKLNPYLVVSNIRVFPGIKNVFVNETKGVVAVKFMDDTVKTATCHKDDTFDVNVGVAICIASYLYGGKKNFHKTVSRKLKK